jgi:hypothetical protein
MGVHAIAHYDSALLRKFDQDYTPVIRIVSALHQSLGF